MCPHSQMRNKWSVHLIAVIPIPISAPPRHFTLAALISALHSVCTDRSVPNIVLVCATDCFLQQLLCCIESLCWVIRAVSCMPAYIAITTSAPTIMQSLSIRYPAIFIQKMLVEE